MKKASFAIATVIWIAFIVGSFLYNLDITIRSNYNTVLEMSKSFFRMIVDTREWNTRHGGVYTVITPDNQPNPFLHDSLRDLVSTNGIRLTKINPAYMNRQIFEIANSKINHFHITSLTPIRPQNAADSWESDALKRLERKEKEVFERVRTDSGYYYRYMAPLYVTKGCLNCHGFQGYRIGMVRGGISITSKASIYDKAQSDNIKVLYMLHSVFLLIGLGGIFVFFRYSQKSYNTISNLLTDLSDSHEKVKDEAMELAKLNVTKDKLFSIVAHDLINPIGNLKLTFELLKNSFDELEYEDKKEYISSSKDSAEEVYNLLQNLLTWSRSQRGKIQTSFEEMSATEIILKIMYTLNTQATNKEITLESDCDPEAIVYADEFMIDTILRNLSTNAIKFSFRGSRVSINARTDGDFTVFSIADSGVGITEENAAKIFDVGSNVSSKGTDNEPSTGLGLVICKEFADKLGGEISLSSQLGKGTTFYVKIPSKKK